VLSSPSSVGEEMAGGESVAEDRFHFGPDVQIEVLLSDWQQARDDERTFALVLATLFGVAIPIIAGASSFLFKTCPRHSTSCTELPHWSFAFLPLIPMLVLGFWVMSAAVAVMRGYYIRALEDQISARGVEVPLGDYGSVRTPALTKLVLPLFSHRRGLFPYFLIFPFLFVTSFVLGVGLTAASVWRTESTPLRVVTGVTYGIYLGMLGLVSVSSGVRARLLLGRLLRHYHSDPTFEPVDEETTGRSLVSYLVLPRPLDLVKAGFITAGVVLAFVLNDGTARPPAWALVVFVLAFEALVYQARYMRNDFADRRLDAGHPGSNARRRVSLLDRPARLAAFEAAFFGRLIAAAAVAALLWLRAGTRIGAAFTVGSLLVWFVGTVYERIKARARRFATPPPLFPRRRPQQLLFVWVGLGYGLRTALGVFVGSAVISGTLAGATVLFLLLLWGIAFGAMFVTMTWALEASTFISPDGTHYSQGLEERADRGTLALESGLLHTDARGTAALTEGGSERLPVILSSSSIRTSWNTAFLIAMFTSGLVASVLAADWRVNGTALAFGVAAALAGGILVALPLVFHVPAWTFLATGSAASAITVACARAAGTPHAWVAFIPAAAVTLTYVSLRMTTYDSLLHPFAPVRPLLATAGAALERRLLGGGVLDALVKAAMPHTTRTPALPRSPVRRRTMRMVIDPEALPETLAWLRASSAIVDLEPLLCVWRSDDSALLKGLQDLFRLISSVETLTDVIVMTNSSRTLRVIPDEARFSFSYVHAARKPWLSLSRFSRLPPPTVLIGDQILTDGLTAWRMQISFVQTRLPREAPFGVRLQAALGALLAPIFFKTGPPVSTGAGDYILPTPGAADPS
jgi:predicted HAD superfamily phosphohydrolase YqeG